MRAREYGVLFALALIWGISFLFIKIAVEDVSPATLVFGRLALSVLTLALIAACRPSLAAGWRRYLGYGLLIGTINNAIPFLLISWGETHIASGVASILNASTPLFTVVLAQFWIGSAHESLTLRRSTGVLIGFLGVAVLIGPAALNLGEGSMAQTLGELAVLIAAAAYAVGALMSKRYAGSAPLAAPLTMQAGALLVVTPVALLWEPPTHLPSLAAFACIVELGVVGTALAYLLYFWLIHHVGPTRTALVTYLLPCTALLWGMIFLGERVSWNSLAGLLLVLLGTMLTNGTLNTKFARVRRLIRVTPQPAAVSVAALHDRCETDRLPEHSHVTE